MILDSYRPMPEWFAHKPYGIHGMHHVTRVLVWADQIAQWMMEQGDDVDVAVVRWAAIVHDVGRWNDGRDPEHGTRAAQWVEDKRGTLLSPLSDTQLQKLQYCCTWHVPRDELIPEKTNELICLKDADGLDRVRIGDLNPAYLRTEIARSHAGDAQTLLDATWNDRKTDPWERVRTAALEHGWWR